MAKRPQGKGRVDIDLTVSDDEDSRPSKTARLTQDSGYHSQTSQPTQTLNSGEYLELDDDEADQLIMSTQDDGNAYQAFETYEKYGSLPTKVVGIRYYNGIATRSEFVSLVREPRNPYDRNAIRVDNVRRQQVGHIPRQVAAKLAKYLDQGLLVVDAQLAGERGEFDVPVELGLYGTSERYGREMLKDMMQRDKLPMQLLQRKEQEEQRRQETELAQVAQWYVGASGSSNQQFKAGLGPADAQNPQEGPTMADIMAGSQVFNPREVGQDSDKFGANEKDLEHLPKADQPKRIATEMLPYQLQALAWLLDKENLKLPAEGDTSIVQLWKRSPTDKRVFTNIATNYSIQHEEPTLASGGILADDMGLGKTLEIISLIVADIERFNIQSSGQRATLIVAPLSVMSNWSGQAAQHVDAKYPLKILTYHGPNKQQINSQYITENQIDVVITTYGTLSTEYMPQSKAKGAKPAPIPRPSGLFSINWRRVVLDEGHSIRNPSTKGALAATSLMARSRWALTGTPIINSLKDLYSLLRFIGITGGLERLDVFSQVLMRPMQRYNERATVLLQAIMTTLCLRRKKEMPFIDLRLPAINEYIHRIQFLKPERERYLALQAEAQGMLREYQMRSEAGRGRRAQEAYNNLLEVLLRLRQICNHWQLCPERMAKLMEALEHQATVELTPENRKGLQDMLQLSIESREDCPICLEDLTGHEPVITHCAHVFGKSCITRVIETQSKCPMCRAPLEDESKLVEPAAGLGEADAGDFPEQIIDPDTSSSKVEALMSILAATHKQPNPKIIVFSQWTRFLSLLEPHLREAGYKYTRLDGTMNATARDAALSTISSDPHTSIMLASLGVCAVGLNLVAANTVVLSDSWWAPAIEDQAVDRVHRLGQKRDCTVWRLVMEESIEERVLSIQEEKRKLMLAAFKETENKRKGRDARMGDIRRLLE